MQKHKAAYRLYFAPNVDAEMYSCDVFLLHLYQLSFIWCYFWWKFWRKMYIYQTLGRMGHWISHSRSHFQKMKNGIYVQKVAFLDNIEKCFEKFQSVRKL